MTTPFDRDAIIREAARRELTAREDAVVPIGEIEKLLRSYDSVHGNRPDARLLVRRVQRWLDTLPKTEANDAAPTPDL